MNFLEKLNEKQKQELALFIDDSERKAEEIRRAQAILLIEEVLNADMIKVLTGLKRETAVKARKRYIKHGINILESKRKEKKPRRLLTKTQREDIAKTLLSKTPREYSYASDTWTTSIVAELILRLYGVLYKSKTSIYVIFKEAKITCHKPKKQYEKRDQKAIDAWKEQNKDRIAAAMSDPDTVILVEDEMILTTQTTLQRVWLPKNTDVIVQHANTRKRRCFYGFLNIKTGEQTAFKSEQITGAVTVKFIKEILRAYPGKKILLFWDNAPWHKGIVMRTFLSTCDNLHLINFPPYAPDENPQEHVWKAVRANVTHNKYIADIDKTSKDVLLYLNNSTFKYSFFGFKAP